MPATNTLKRVRSDARSAAAVTISFVAVAVVLAELVARVVMTMAAAANEIDDARAEQIAHTVFSEPVEIRGAATKDHAAWCDAKAIFASSASSDWDHWGKTTEEYASIGALRQFGFDRMKLDRSLVSGLDDNSKDIDILRATVALATALDIPVTAEGIENTHQAEILRQTGCDQFQGFLVGKPMSAAEIAAKLTQQGVAA